MNCVDVLLQAHGLADITVLSVKPTATLAEVVSNISVSHKDRLLFLEDVDGPVDNHAVVEELLPIAVDDTAIGPLRLHLARCRHVDVVVRFNGEKVERLFTPSATIERVRRWAALRAFQLPPRDAAEHVLQIQGSTDRPDRDVHVGTLTTGHACQVIFDLVPCQRVEG